MKRLSLVRRHVYARCKGIGVTMTAAIDQSMFRFIWRYSRRDQLLILAVVILSLPFYFLALDLPRTIVNQAIQGEGFENGQTRTAFEIALPATGVLDERIILFGGVELERMAFLVCMSLLFLTLVIINGLFKLQINTAKGRLGERMLRRLRFMLYERILQFAPERFRSVRAPELATMIKDEVEPLGGFIGDAYVQPVFLGGQVATALLFIFIQNVWLGAVAGTVALAQAVVIPRMRAPILVLGRQRQLTARTLAGRIGDSVDGIAEIHANGTADYERAAIGGLLGHIFAIRFELYQRKFLVKFVNNLLAQLTPFLFFLVGGYFAITGRLDVGQLVAVIVAYKELPGPMKELIDWDQRRLDTGIKYEQVVLQFEIPASTAPVRPGIEDAPRGTLEIANLTVADGDVPVIERLSLTVKPGETVLLDGSGATAVLEAAAHLRTPTGGTVRRGGMVSYVGERANLSGRTVFDALAYGLLHLPPTLPDGTEQTEARRTGNPLHSADGDWIDYGQAGVEDRSGLRTAMLATLAMLEADHELYSWGLRRPVDGNVDGERLMRARALIAARLETGHHARLVERFDRDSYNIQATIGENIVFGAFTGDALSFGTPAFESHALAALREAGIEDAMVAMGRAIGATMVELFADLSPDNPLVETFSFVAGEDLPNLKDILSRDRPDDADRARLLNLTFSYCETRHRLELLTPDLMDGIVRARGFFRPRLPKHLRGAVAFYDPDRPTTGALLIDDILFGKIAETAANARERVEKLVHDVLAEQGLLPVVLEAGLSHEIGTAGRRLSTAQRQRLALARALLRRPDILLIDRALAMVDPEQETRIVGRIVARPDIGTILAALGSDKAAQHFVRHITFDGSQTVRDSHPPQTGGARAWD